MNNGRNSVNKLVHVRQRKLTLLEKVSKCYVECSYEPSIFMPFVCIHRLILNVRSLRHCELLWPYLSDICKFVCK
jgi:hypothetical protein